MSEIKENKQPRNKMIGGLQMNTNSNATAMTSPTAGTATSHHKNQVIKSEGPLQSQTKLTQHHLSPIADGSLKEVLITPQKTTRKRHGQFNSNQHHHIYKSQSEAMGNKNVTDNIFNCDPSSFAQPANNNPMIDEINLEEDEDGMNEENEELRELYKYTFEKDLLEDDEGTGCSPKKEDDLENEIENLDYQDQYYQKKGGENGVGQAEEDGCIEGEEVESECEEADVVVKEDEGGTIGGTKEEGESSPTKQTSNARGSIAVPQNDKKPQVTVREVRYTVYGENLEQTLKLLSCQKGISLIDKKDPKSRRMFITAQHIRPVPQAPSILDSTVSMEAVIKKAKTVPDGHGGPSKKIIQALNSTEIFEPKSLYSAQIIDGSNKQAALGKMKKLLETIGMLGLRYVSLDDFRSVLIADMVKPLKKKKLYTFLNPENLLMVTPQSEPLLKIYGGGLRPLLQEFDFSQNQLLNQMVNRIKILKNVLSTQQPPKFQPRVTQAIPQPIKQKSNSTSSNLLSQQSSNLMNPTIKKPQQQNTNTQGENAALIEPYRRFRYNFHYWLKNFKYNEDGTFQFMMNENTSLVGTSNPQQQQVAIPPNIVKAGQTYDQGAAKQQVGVVGLEESPIKLKSAAGVGDEIQGRKMPMSNILPTPKQQIKIYPNNKMTVCNIQQNGETKVVGEEIPIPMIAQIDSTLNNTKKNFFVLGPNGIKQVQDPGQSAKQSKNLQPGSYLKPNPNLSNITKGKNSAEAQTVLDSLMHLKVHQEEIKRRRFKPTSSPVGSGLSHARNDINSRGSPLKTTFKQTGNAEDQYQKVKNGGTQEEDQEESLEASLNFRPIRGVNKSNRNNILSQNTTIGSLAIDDARQVLNNQGGLEMISPQSIKNWHSNPPNASKLLTQNQSPNLLIQSPAQKSSFDHQVFPIPGLMNGSAARNMIDGNTALMRFKHQPHSSVLAGGFCPPDLNTHQSLIGGSHRLSIDNQGLKFLGILSDRMNNGGGQSTKHQSGLRQAAPNIEELITSQIFQQQMNFSSTSGAGSLSQNAGKPYATEQAKAIIGAIADTPLPDLSKKSPAAVSGLVGSTGKRKSNAEQIYKNFPSQVQVPPVDKSEPITNLYQLMKQGGNINSILLQKQNSLGPSAQSMAPKQRPSNYNIRGGNLKESQVGGGASLRSLRAGESKTASTGLITQTLLPKTDSKPVISQNNQISINPEEENCKPRTPLGGKLPQAYQHVSMSPARGAIDPQQSLIMAQEEYMAQIAQQYPPGTVFFDKLKRKSAAIINFMNMMSGGSKQVPQTEQQMNQTLANYHSQKSQPITSQNIEAKALLQKQQLPLKLAINIRPVNPPSLILQGGKSHLAGKSISLSVPAKGRDSKASPIQNGVAFGN